MAVLNLRAMICITGLTMAIHIHGNETTLGLPKNIHYTSSDILAGIGYSEDTEQMTAQRCYNVIAISTSEQQSYVKLSQASSSSELERELGISASLSGGYGEFSAEAKASYLRSLVDNDYGMSLNYYEYSSNQVTAQLAGPGDDALNDSGKSFYENGENPNFGLMCGDYYVSSYQQGALLTMGLYIKFSSSVEKLAFEQEAGASFGSIMSASESIKNANAKRQFTGSITVQAYQMGGEPNKLSQVFDKNSAGDYYALTCSLTAIDDCIKTASGLLDYATNNFPKQYSFEKNIGLSPLGMAFSEYQPIEWIGLTPSVSRVTDEVKQYRIDLSNKLRENKYYQSKLYPFLNNGYPAKLVINFVRDASSLQSRVGDNLRILMQSHGGAADCYHNPDECKDTKASIISQLRDITISDLKFLNDIKYRLNIRDNVWYNKGENIETSWDVVFGGPNNFRVFRVSVTSDRFNFFLVDSIGNDWSYQSLAINNDTYLGDECLWGSCTKIMTKKTLSPYFFELFNVNDPDLSVNEVLEKKKIRLSFSISNNSKNSTR